MGNFKEVYYSKLNDKRWITKRNEILLRDNYSCRRCRWESDLEVHHIKYTGEPWDALDIDLITLCECCHKSIHIKQSYRGVIYSVADITFTNRIGRVITMAQSIKESLNILTIKVQENGRR